MIIRSTLIKQQIINFFICKFKKLLVIKKHKDFKYLASLFRNTLSAALIKHA